MLVRGAPLSETRAESETVNETAMVGRREEDLERERERESTGQAAVEADSVSVCE